MTSHGDEQWEKFDVRLLPCVKDELRRMADGRGVSLGQMVESLVVAEVALEHRRKTRR